MATAQINLDNILLNTYCNGYSKYMAEYSKQYERLQYEKKLDLAKSAAVVDKIIELIDVMGVKTGDVFRAFEKLVVEDKISVNILKRLNYSNFRAHLTKWRKEGKEASVKLKRQGNQNAVKHKCDAELEAWIYSLRFSPRNLSGEHIKRVVKHNCLINGKEIPSDSWLSQKLADGHLKAMASMSRFDRGNRHRQTYESVLHGLRTPLANDRWEMDSTRVNLQAFEHNGRAVFLYVTWVYDNHSGDVLGWAFSSSNSPENRWVYTEALKMAVNRTGALPSELVTDRFPGHNTDEVKRLFNKLELMGVKISITHRAEGKQHLERAIGTFQTVFLSQSNYYYGQGVKSTREAAHVTSEWQKNKAKELRRLGIGYEQMCNEAERFIDQYRTTKTTEYGRENKSKLPYSPAELWQVSTKDNQIKVENWQISDLFWLEKRLSMRNRQFKTEINHETCVYMIENYELLVRLEREKTAVIRYDETDLSEIYVFSEETNEFLGCVKRFEIDVTRGSQANGHLIGKYKQKQAEINKAYETEKAKVLAAIDESKLTAYWGKEAIYRTEEAMLVEGFGQRQTDVYDHDWNN